LIVSGENQMKLTWFGHSAFRVEIGSSVLLIDPFLKHNPSFTGEFSEAVKGVTHILLTHGHDDHVGDAVEIGSKASAGSAKPQIISNYEVCAFLASQGADNMNPGNTGGTVPCGEFTVSFTQAHHSSGTVVDGKSIYLGNPNGLVVKHLGSPTFYHMGDTDLFSDMALIAELHKPDIALVPIGDRFTMDANAAALAMTRFVKPKIAIPVHYATFGLLAPNADGFVKAMAGSGIDVLVPKPGETLSF
jgi:L-ascorbate metabolism protein UlaG (beta-lactamase superfamily)